MSADYEVIVIGAGLGGLTAAALLQKHGKRVLLLEQGREIGGYCSSYPQDNYLVDVGAGRVEYTSILDELFRLFNCRKEDYLRLIPCDPLFGLIFDDGTRAAYPPTIEGTEAVIAGWSSEDAHGWRRYARDCEKFQGLIQDYILHKITHPGEMAALSIKHRECFWLGLRFLTRNFRQVFESYFRHPKTLASFAFQSWGFGLPPRFTPGIMAVVGHAMYKGLYYPQGGMKALPQALHRIFQESGGTTKLDALVTKVLLAGRKVIGVSLADGTEILADKIVSNVNGKSLYQHLIGEEHLPAVAVKAIRFHRLSPSAYMIYLALKDNVGITEHHTVLVPPELMDYGETFWYTEYQEGRLPREPYALISCPTLSDPALAPEGHILVNLAGIVPYNLAAQDWDKVKGEWMDYVIDWYTKRAFPDLKKSIVWKHINSPKEFARRTNSPEGAVYGLENNLFSFGMFRLKNISPIFEQLYLTGATTHPGGGVPLVIASGIIAAREILKSEGTILS